MTSSTFTLSRSNIVSRRALVACSRVFAVVLAAFFSPPLTPAIAGPDPNLSVYHRNCSWLDHFALAHRTSSVSCAVSYRIEGPDFESKGRAYLCIPLPLWRAWLTSDPPSSWCGEMSGSWSLFSPPANDPLRQEKEIYERFTLKSLPAPKMNAVLGQRLSTTAQFHRQTPIFWMQKIEKVRESLSQELAPHDPWGVFRKLSLGETNPDAPYELLRVLGFVHILRASGIHLLALSSLVRGFLMFFFENCGAPLVLSLWASRFISLLLSVWAWILGGCHPGMIRPWILILTRWSARWLGLRLHPWTPLIAMFVLNIACEIILRGKTDLTSSLYYSLAVGGGYLGVHLQKSVLSKPVAAALGMATGAWVFIAIVELYFNHWVAIFCPILSVLSIPLICSLLYPWIVIQGFLYFLDVRVTAVVHPLLQVSTYLCNGWLHFLTNSNLKFGGLWIIEHPERLIFFSAIVSSMVCLFLKSRKTRILIRFLMIVILIKSVLHDTSKGLREKIFPENSTAMILPPEAREITQLDVGQGDAAAVVLANGSAGLIDTGSAKAMNEAQWLQTLAKLNIRKLDFVGLTHLDEDHQGSLEILSKIIRIRCIATSEEELTSPRGRLLQAAMAERGIPLQSWKQGCVTLDVLEPPKISYRSRKNNSLMSALLIHTENHAFYLIAGDAEGGTAGGDELRIAQWAQKKILAGNNHADLRILKISHHGSKTSSSVAVLRTYRPELAIISSGVGNHYGHPHSEVLKRLEEEKIPVLRTDQNGAIRVEAFHRPLPSHHP